MPPTAVICKRSAALAPHCCGRWRLEAVRCSFLSFIVALLLTTAFRRHEGGQTSEKVSVRDNFHFLSDSDLALQESEMMYGQDILHLVFSIIVSQIVIHLWPHRQPNGTYSTITFLDQTRAKR